MWRTWTSAIVLMVMLIGWWPAQPAVAQEADAPAVAAGGAPAGMEVRDADVKAKKAKNPMAFGAVLTNSGLLGIILWLALFACSIGGITLIIDSIVTIKERKIAPQELVSDVREAMSQGDVMKVLKHCADKPGPLANILTAGFQNVQEGFEVIQEQVGVVADLESEKLMQRITYLNVVANLATMLGLLGTVQGMIYAFASLGTQAAGAAQQSMLAISIAQALYTTAAGLSTAVPAIAAFYFFKNRATRIILGMEALTLDLIKALRNVEVVTE